MKQAWRKWALKVDQMKLREQLLVFAVGVLLLLVLLNLGLLGPLLGKQKSLSEQIAQQQDKLTGMAKEINQARLLAQFDPDVASRNRLQALKLQSLKLNNDLLAMQKGLVGPDKVALLLEAILKANGRLQLLSLKTVGGGNLNAAGLSAAGKPGAQPGLVAPPAPMFGAKTAPASLLYRHDVSIVVRGRYLDLIDYLNALEAMPAQLFWGDATLAVDTYPQANLTLSIYTLSLDKKWITL